MSEPTARFRRRSISSSETSVPPARSVSRAPDAIVQASRMSGTSARISSTRAACSAVSDSTAIAPESERIQLIWAAELVS